MVHGLMIPGMDPSDWQVWLELLVWTITIWRISRRLHRP